MQERRINEWVLREACVLRGTSFAKVCAFTQGTCARTKTWTSAPCATNRIVEQSKKNPRSRTCSAGRVEYKKSHKNVRKTSSLTLKKNAHTCSSIDTFLSSSFARVCFPDCPVSCAWVSRCPLQSLNVQESATGVTKTGSHEPHRNCTTRTAACKGLTRLGFRAALKDMSLRAPARKGMSLQIPHEHKQMKESEGSSRNYVTHVLCDATCIRAAKTDFQKVDIQKAPHFAPARTHRPREIKFFLALRPLETCWSAYSSILKVWAHSRRL